MHGRLNSASVFFAVGVMIFVGWYIIRVQHTIRKIDSSVLLDSF